MREIRLGVALELLSYPPHYLRVVGNRFLAMSEQPNQEPLLHAWIDPSVILARQVFVDSGKRTYRRTLVAEVQSLPHVHVSYLSAIYRQDLLLHFAHR